MQATSFDLPREPNGLEKIDSFLRKEGVATFAVESVLFTLLGDPLPESTVTRVVLGDDAVSVL